jgi:putative Ca2+/H+ antiporter (TMEM165/GDT1 family)
MDLHCSLDPRLLASTFGIIFVAELPDKTAFATVMLGSGRRPFATFVGVAAAFLIQTIVAVACGRVLGLLPHEIVRWVAGTMFLAFSVLMLKRRAEEIQSGGHAQDPAARPPFWSAAMKAFLVIFIAEWGDLTQLATAALVAKNPGAITTVFVGSLAALWVVTAIAIAIGHQLQRRISARLLQRLAAVAFAIIGLLILSGIGRGG